MQKTLTVSVDDTTWQSNSPSFPRTFHRGECESDFHIPSLLLLLGFITTPPVSFGASLSEYWAWIRYFCAISTEADLRLVNEFHELDPHQKTILSDDFGMAVPMYWLLEKLSLGPVAHGRYFIDHIAHQLSATTERSTKRGPSKSPDFVAMDHQGKWHVIECKGTQSGIAYRNRQLGTSSNPTNGAVSQKRTITFPNSLSGQRLACGLSISFQADQQPSNLRIIDPVGEDPFTIEENHEPLAKDAVWRAVGGRSLLLSGFRVAASAVVDPFGRFRRSKTGQKQDSELFQEAISEKISLVTEELEGRDQHVSFRSADQNYYGRYANIELPEAIDVEGRAIHRVQIHQGVSGDFLDDITRYPVVKEPLHGSKAEWQELIGRTACQFDGLEARFKIGSLFLSEIRLQS